jgi:hypothetical protein
MFVFIYTCKYTLSLGDIIYTGDNGDEYDDYDGLDDNLKDVEDIHTCIYICTDNHIHI